MGLGPGLGQAGAPGSRGLEAARAGFCSSLGRSKVGVLLEPPAPLPTDRPQVCHAPRTPAGSGKGLQLPAPPPGRRRAGLLPPAVHTLQCTPGSRRLTTLSPAPPRWATPAQAPSARLEVS